MVFFYSKLYCFKFKQKMCNMKHVKILYIELVHVSSYMTKKATYYYSNKYLLCYLFFGLKHSSLCLIFC